MEQLVPNVHLPYEIKVRILGALCDIEKGKIFRLLTLSHALSPIVQEHLWRNVHLTQTKQIQQFVDAVDQGKIPVGAVWSLALEDRAAAINASLSEWPDDNEEESAAWIGITRLASLLYQHNMKSMAIANTAAKHIVNEFSDGAFPWAVFFPKPMILDVLAVTGSDLDAPQYLKRIKSRAYRVYGCRHAFFNEGSAQYLRRSHDDLDSARRLEIMLGGFYDNDPAQTVNHMTMEFSRPLNHDLSADWLMPVITIYLRAGLPRREEFRGLIELAQSDPRSCIALKVEVIDWFPRGRTQLETERLDWIGGGWTGTPARDPLRDYHTDTEPWCDCDTLEIRHFEEWDDAGIPPPTQFELNLAVKLSGGTET